MFHEYDEIVMTPEYIEMLADLADPDSLWKLGGLEQLKLPEDQRQKLDAGVALRRHASHVRRVQSLLGTGKSLVITPLSLNGSASLTMAAPAEHQTLLSKSYTDKSKETTLDAKGCGPWKKEWYSICSIHRRTNSGCHLCTKGTWVNVWKQRASNVVYRKYPDLWRWWANRE